MYMAGLLLFPAYKKWPHLANTSKWLGMPLMSAGLIAASFANDMNHLILTQGVIYAIGGCIIYFPTVLFVDEWFIQRKGLAYGVLWVSPPPKRHSTLTTTQAGTGSAGLIIPFLLTTLLEKYGFRTTLRIWSLAILILSMPLLYFLRPRLPISAASQSPRYGLAFLRSSTFWVLHLSLVIESLGYFLPSIYLPTFAAHLGLSPATGSLLVALLNGAAVFATIIMGMLIDRFHVTTVMLFSTIGAVVSVFLFWGLSNALPLLVVFSIMYGFFAGGFVSTIAGIIKLVKGYDQSADVGMMIGVTSAGRGVGSVLSGPLSGALLRGGVWRGKVGFGYGSGFGELIVFTGVTAAVGGMSWFGKRLGWIR